MCQKFSFFSFDNLLYSFPCCFFQQCFHRILEHDDSLTDRSDGGILDTNFQATKSLWFDVYSKEYKVPGGMYRGEPPKEFFTADWARDDKTVPQQTLSNTFIFPGVSLAHLIGEVGASSVGRDENSQLTWISVDDPKSFLRPLPKSQIKYVNANPIKDMYVFGSGGKAYLGFGHMILLLV